MRHKARVIKKPINFKNHFKPINTLSDKKRRKSSSVFDRTRQNLSYWNWLRSKYYLFSQPPNFDHQHPLKIFVFSCLEFWFSSHKVQDFFCKQPLTFYAKTFENLIKTTLLFVIDYFRKTILSNEGTVALSNNSFANSDFQCDCPLAFKYELRNKNIYLRFCWT